MNSVLGGEGPKCWICGEVADTGEHLFKASDIRAAVVLSQQKPVYLQVNVQPTNKPIGSAKAKALQFTKSLCAACNSKRTQRYDLAWQRLSEYARLDWRAIRRRGSLDMKTCFGSAFAESALDVHLYFLKLFGCKVVQDGEPLDVARFVECILDRAPHPDVSLYIANSASRAPGVIAFESDVYKVWHQPENRLDGALWGYSIPPIAVKVCYIRDGVPLYCRGRPWHPSRRKRFVRFSPYYGAVEPIPGLAVDL